jgi:hypothetical protein
VVYVETRRGFLRTALLWRAKQERGRVQQLRLRRARFGALLQIDGSDHAWSEDRASRSSTERPWSPARAASRCPRQLAPSTPRCSTGPALVGQCGRQERLPCCEQLNHLRPLVASGRMSVVPTERDPPVEVAMHGAWHVDHCRADPRLAQSELAHPWGASGGVRSGERGTRAVNPWPIAPH